MNKKLKEEYISLTSNKRLYQMEFPIIGLTGGIACGKSTVADIISTNFNIPIINADVLVKKAYEESEVLEFLRGNCPKAIINNKVDFSVLRQWVFSKNEHRSSIESTIYKHLPQLFKKEALKFNTHLIIYDVPLLFEKELNSQVDFVICVSCERQTQVNRVIKRDNCSAEIANKIIDSQMDLKEKEKMSNLVFQNNLDLEHLKKEVKNKVKMLLIS